MDQTPFELEIGDGTLHGHYSGKGAPALLLHGGPGLPDMTEGCAAELFDIFTPIRYTQRGTLPSTVGGPYTIESHMADALAVLDAFELDKAWAIGHSWGGHLALHLVANYPERFHGIVCIGTLGASLDVLPEFEENLLRDLSDEQRDLVKDIDARSEEGEASEEELLESLSIIWPYYFADPASAPPVLGQAHRRRMRHRDVPLDQGALRGRGAPQEAAPGPDAGALRPRRPGSVAVAGRGRHGQADQGRESRSDAELRPLPVDRAEGPPQPDDPRAHLRALTRGYASAMEFETRAIHDGQEPDPTTGAAITPIYQTSTYVQEAVGVNKGYDYSRVGNPTRTALETALASLEEAKHGVAFSSGLGATTTLMHLVDPGERVVLIADVYGGVYRMTSQVYEPKGYRFTYVPAEEFDENLAAHLGDDVKIVWVETPSNPLLNIVDIRRAADAAHAVGALLVVDNTFASPYLQQPLALGADLVVHSTTKYLGGHSDVIGGFVATNDDGLADRLRFLQKSLGAVPGPFDCWLVLRGMKTLALRMRQHSENARAIAGFLDEHPAVERVLYPGLPNHPGHDVARKQMRDFGGMVSFQVESEAEAVALVARTKLFLLAESLGGVESLIEHPARMTHASTADAPFASPRNLVRLSVGIEAVGDLIADLETALVRQPARV